jgi:hypothetical protein
MLTCMHLFVLPTVNRPYKLNIHTVLYCPPFCSVVLFMPPPHNNNKIIAVVIAKKCFPYSVSTKQNFRKKYNAKQNTFKFYFSPKVASVLLNLVFLLLSPAARPSIREERSTWWRKWRRTQRSSFYEFSRTKMTRCFTYCTVRELREVFYVVSSSSVYYYRLRLPYAVCPKQKIKCRPLIHWTSRRFP